MRLVCGATSRRRYLCYEKLFYMVVQGLDGMFRFYTVPSWVSHGVLFLWQRRTDPRACPWPNDNGLVPKLATDIDRTFQSAIATWWSRYTLECDGVDVCGEAKGPGGRRSPASTRGLGPLLQSIYRLSILHASGMTHWRWMTIGARVNQSRMPNIPQPAYHHLLFLLWSLVASSLPWPCYVMC